jgi:aldose 1-epimerase
LNKLSVNEKVILLILLKRKNMNYFQKTFRLLSLLTLSIACNNSSKPSNQYNMETQTDYTLPEKSAFQSTIDGKKTDLYILKNKNNMQAAITNYGGRIVSLLVPDHDKLIDVSVGFDNVKSYEDSTEPYFGALIGRYGNRIAKGKFSLDKNEYSLFINNGKNTLHGGEKSFRSVVWDAKQIGENVLELSYLSKDMEEGYPGNLTVKVVYTLTDENELTIHYEAITDKKTVLNLTNHTYFNLNGCGSGDILGHKLMLNADNYTPVDVTLIPTGKVVSVKNTPFDFIKLTVIGSRIDAKDEQIKFGGGYDHNFVLNPNSSKVMNFAAKVVADKSNIVMEVYTEEPGIQFYTGNFMNSTHTIKGGKKDDKRTAFCLETQHFPDSPNQPTFPTTVLEVGKKYKTNTVYKFSLKEK